MLDREEICQTPRQSAIFFNWSSHAAHLRPSAPWKAQDGLDQAALLKDSATRPGKALRDLLRAKSIRGQRQELNGRWHIDSAAIRLTAAPSNKELDQRLSSRAKCVRWESRGDDAPVAHYLVQQRGRRDRIEVGWSADGRVFSDPGATAHAILPGSPEMLAGVTIRQLVAMLCATLPGQAADEDDFIHTNADQFLAYIADAVHLERDRLPDGRRRGAVAALDHH
jgi:hypothetical protein